MSSLVSHGNDRLTINKIEKNVRGERFESLVN